MTRIAAVLSAAAVVLLTGFVHGTWTQRWRQSQEVHDAVARLDAIPTRAGNWTAEEVEPIAPEVLQAAGVQGCWMRNFTSAETGQHILVLVLCGSTGKMCAHRPENCYPGQGYDLVAVPLRQVVKSSGGVPVGEFWSARFAKPDVTTGSSQLRILWAWNAAGRWLAPDYPRWTFASQPYLYKLYLVRELPLRLERTEDDPAAEFLRQFLPKLTTALAPE